MSLAVTDTPVPVQRLVIPTQDIRAFCERHRSTVRRDVAVATRLVKPGKYFKRVITPRSVLVRHERASFVREDFTEPRCAHSVMMRKLYRDMIEELHRSDIEVSFDHEPQDVLIDGEMTPITMLAVHFYMSPSRAV